MTTERWLGLEIDERTVPVPGGEITVAFLGEGPALVLIHGISSSGEAWAPVADALSRHFRLIAVDQRGHGSSFKPEHGYLLADYAGDLQAILEHFELERPLIMGHSLGGMVALEWATRHPETAAALVVEDSPMRYGGPGSEEMFDGWIATNQLSIPEAEEFYRQNYPGMSDWEVRRRARNITQAASGVFTDLKTAMLAVQGALVVDRYTPIRTPTLLVYGDVEPGGMVPETDAQAFERHLAHAETVRIPGVGHGLHNDAPEQFLDIVLPFLHRHAVTASRVAAETM